MHTQRHTGKLLIAGAAAAAGIAGVLGYRRWRRLQSGNPAVPEPAKPVDLERYLGLWHELGRYPNRFERGCEAVTAEYALGPGGLVEVTNTCRGESGAVTCVAHGRARPVPGSNHAKFKVSFFGPLFLGDYWVLDHADDYSWSIVGEPSGRFLWILSREAWPSNTEYEFLVARAREMGYDMERFRRTRQAA